MGEIWELTMQLRIRRVYFEDLQGYNPDILEQMEVNHGTGETRWKAIQIVGEEE